MDIVSLITLFGISIGVFLGLLLLTFGRGNKNSNRLFGILLLSFSISITGFVIERTGFSASFPHFYGIPQMVLFLFGPLFYFYVKMLTKKKFNFREEHILHFLPFVFFVIYQIPFLVKSGEEKIHLLTATSLRTEWLGILAIQILHLFVYIYFTNKLIRKHQKRIKSTMSSIERINLRWLWLGMFSFVSVFSFMLLVVILYFSGINLIKYFQVAVPISVSLIICIMGYYGLKQPIIFPNAGEKKLPKKYEKSSLNEALSEEYLVKLVCYMDEQKPYLQSNLTLQKLAHAISISAHHLSQIINEQQNQNFFDFINQYRVKEAQKLLLHPQGQLLTILAISEEVGFNSKTAFNAAFKKITKMTPSEYRKKGLS